VAGSVASTLPSARIERIAPAGTVIGPPLPMTGRPSPFWSTPLDETDKSPRRV